MPGMDGEGVIERMRAAPEMAATPVIMLVAADRTEPDSPRLGAGELVLLSKPVRSSLLYDTITTILGDARPGRKIEWHAQPAPVAAPGGGVLDILVAEDNEVNQLVFSQILDGTGFRYEIVSNGREAVAMHGERKPRLILMDVSMPEMSGLEATAEIRKSELAAGLAPTPIIGITAHALKGDRERCLQAGMTDYLSKPVSPDRLIEKIQPWLPARAEPPDNRGPDSG